MHFDILSSVTRLKFFCGLIWAVLLHSLRRLHVKWTSYIGCLCRDFPFWIFSITTNVTVHQARQRWSFSRRQVMRWGLFGLLTSLEEDKITYWWYFQMLMGSAAFLEGCAIELYVPGFERTSTNVWLWWLHVDCLALEALNLLTSLASCVIPAYRKSSKSLEHWSHSLPLSLTAQLVHSRILAVQTDSIAGEGWSKIKFSGLMEFSTLSPTVVVPHPFRSPVIWYAWA